MEERKRKDWSKEDKERKSSKEKPAARYGDRKRIYKPRKTSADAQDAESKPQDDNERKPASFDEGIIIRKEGGEKKYEGSGPKPSEIKREAPAEKKPYEKKDNDFRPKTQDSRPKTQSPRFGERKPFGERKAAGEKRGYGTRDSRDKTQAPRPSGRFEDRDLTPGKRKPAYSSSKDSGKRGYGEEKKPFATAETLRLNKFIANAGICSRRQADVHIAEGDVTVNGEVVNAMGYRVLKTDDVKFKGKKVEYGHKVYVLLNKPKDFITTKSDDFDRKTVMELVKGATDETIYPVGRLDRNTTGLLLLTNDGDLTQQLTHPSFGISKIYHVGLNKPVTKEDMEKIAKGVELEDGIAVIDDIAYADAKDKSQVGIELHIGKNRIVRRIFETLGYDVIKLDRVVYAGITKKDLSRGKWRFLSEKEVMQLKKFNEKR